MLLRWRRVYFVKQLITPRVAERGRAHAHEGRDGQTRNETTRTRRDGYDLALARTARESCEREIELLRTRRGLEREKK